MQEKMLWYWINNLTGIGHAAITGLLNYFDSLEEVYKASSNQLSKVLSLKQAEFLTQSKGDWVERDLERLEKMSVKFLWKGHPDYPDKLLNLYDAPYGLYLRGGLPVEGQHSIAIIGARKADYYGLEMAEYFGRELAKKGVSVISGLAEGVDGHAHKGALKGKGYTLGILGCGINICYPKENYGIFEKMLLTGGVLSEYGLDIPPRAGLFPLRNRLIAAMSDGILVIEARKKSGSLITVDQGLEQGKDIFAIPGRLGDSLSEGCNELIRSGAKIVTSIEDIMEEWGEISLEDTEFQIHRKNALVKIEKMVYSVLGLEPKYIDIIIEETQLDAGQLLPVLMRLERQGYIKQIRPNYYCVAL